MYARGYGLNLSSPGVDEGLEPLKTPHHEKRINMLVSRTRGKSCGVPCLAPAGIVHCQLVVTSASLAAPSLALTC